jgi:hypothetical protein
MEPDTGSAARWIRQVPVSRMDHRLVPVFAKIVILMVPHPVTGQACSMAGPEPGVEISGSMDIMAMDMAISPLPDPFFPDYPALF